MSASLVGSEMCIRDRPRLDKQGRRWRGGAASPPVWGAPWPRRPALGGKPVSYTHLTLPTICSV
eukprot:10316901-Alexandrium_andersonii.AAC.1